MSNYEPVSCEKDVVNLDWVKAMDAEVKALQDNNIQKSVGLPESKQAGNWTQIGLQGQV